MRGLIGNWIPRPSGLASKHSWTNEKKLKDTRSDPTQFSLQTLADWALWEKQKNRSDPLDQFPERMRRQMSGYIFRPFFPSGSRPEFAKTHGSAHHAQCTAYYVMQAASCVLLSLTADALDCETQNIDVCHGKGSLSRTEKEEEIDIDLPFGDEGLGILVHP
ncbi:hypothetical protein OUZ56_004019 [Daphnia magna]|uniref:Uncharacterized protein n=1 Tax=Daphnia magna TaxID=35525 RepID=A0ABQ9YNI0_9CRUS|nr:hypothetical protein OUZ56_004019 [Daphnia magna]